MLLGISPGEHRNLQTKLKKKYKLARLLFVLTLFLPLLVILFFYLGIFKGSSKLDAADDNELFKPIVKVVAGNSQGSGFLVGESTIITARHVIGHKKSGDTVIVSFDKATEIESCEATIDWYEEIDPELRGTLEYFLTDIATLKVIKPRIIPDDFPRLAVEDQSMAYETDEVIAAGYPNSYFAVTQGIISNTEFEGEDLLNVDIQIYKGHSGGALINKESNKAIGILVGGHVGEYAGQNVVVKIENVLDKLYSEGIDYLE